MQKTAILRLVALAVLVAAIAASLVFLPVQEYLRDVLDWTKGLGAWGPIVLAAIYVPACVFLVPGSLVTLAGGALFGVVQGTIAVSVGSVAGASAAFFVGRFLARDWIESRVARNPKFRAIDQAVGEQGFKIVLLTRLSPVFPFNLLNYAYGLTRVRFRDYLLASWIGMLPGTILYVYLGSLAGEVANAAVGDRQRTPAEWTLYGVGLAATVVVTIFVTRVARQALDRAIADTRQDAETAPPSAKVPS